MGKLILVRHGMSDWNEEGYWSGWADVELSEKGIEEAQAAGKAIQDIPLDGAFTSKLIRAQQTLDEILMVTNQKHIPVTETHALDEKSYGDLTGKNKWQVEQEYGEEQFALWRRSWDVAAPNGETLKDVYDRVVPYYKDHILPLVEEGKNILVSAHGNSLRALVKYIDTISDEDIPQLEIGVGEIYIYTMDNQGKVLNKEILNKPANAGKI